MGGLMALLNVERVSYAYRGGRGLAVDDVSFTVESGQSLGIVGESGSGKSTLAKLIVGAALPRSGALTIGATPWSAVKRTDPIRGQVQMIFQNPHDSLNPWMRASTAVEEAVRRWRPGARSAAKQRAVELLGRVGLNAREASRYPRELSGGQAQRVGIARALAAQPKLIVADEPTSALDASVQAQILNLLVDLQATESLALVLISHDISVIEYATASALVMYRGRIMERGPSAELIGDPLHPYTRLLTATIPGTRRTPVFSVNDVPADSGCVFAQACAWQEPRCLERIPETASLNGRLVECWKADHLGEPEPPIAGSNSPGSGEQPRSGALATVPSLKQPRPSKEQESAEAEDR
jgi:oligopeptide/dipeptide ABC transporter ATP-binding protein